jgi:hypothetical protein
MNKQQQSTFHINDIWDELLNSQASQRFLQEQVKKAEEFLATTKVTSPPDLDS